MREMELTMVPANLLHDPNLPLATKGAAAVMLSYADLHCTSVELATLLGVNENRAITICLELQNAGYENIFRLYKHNETDD